MRTALRILIGSLGQGDHALGGVHCLLNTHAPQPRPSVSIGEISHNLTTNFSECLLIASLSLRLNCGNLSRDTHRNPSTSHTSNASTCLDRRPSVRHPIQGIGTFCDGFQTRWGASAYACPILDLLASEVLGHRTHCRCIYITSDTRGRIGAASALTRLTHRLHTSNRV
jgi:hypothetical protein